MLCRPGLWSGAATLLPLDPALPTCLRLCRGHPLKKLPSHRGDPGRGGLQPATSQPGKEAPLAHSWCSRHASPAGAAALTPTCASPRVLPLPTHLAPPSHSSRSWVALSSSLLLPAPDAPSDVTNSPSRLHLHKSPAQPLRPSSPCLTLTPFSKQEPNLVWRPLFAPAPVPHSAA